MYAEKGKNKRNNKHQIQSFHLINTYIIIALIIITIETIYIQTMGECDANAAIGMVTIRYY